MWTEIVLCLLTKGDELTYYLETKFSTKDQDNDYWGSTCATHRKGAWWYGHCSHSNLNGRYYTGGKKSIDGVYWYDWRADYYSLKFSEMKIRPFDVWLTSHISSCIIDYTSMYLLYIIHVYPHLDTSEIVLCYETVYLLAAWTVIRRLCVQILINETIWNKMRAYMITGPMWSYFLSKN